MAKTRILYIESNRDGTVGGSYYSLFYLVEGLDKNIYEPIVMFYEENPLIEKFEKVVKEVIIFDHDSPFSGCIRSFGNFIKFIPRFVRDILWAQFEIIKKIDEIKPDIVHLNNSYAANHDWVLACKLKGVKIIAHDRGTMPPASLQTRFFVRLLDAIISVSDSYLQYITGQGLKPKLACRVYNGLALKDFSGQYSTEQRNQLRKNLDVNDDDILIGMVGNIIYWKGQIVLVKAMTRIVKKQQNVKVLLVGKTVSGGEAYEHDIKTCISQNKLNDKIFFTGYREDIPALLDAFDIFIHASVEPEPFGRVIIEAMARKKPIIATKLGGPSEIIVHGESGVLIAMNDEIAMADAILNYIADMSKAEKIGQNAFKRVVEKFSAQNMVQGVEAVYNEILTH
ncbi:MAG: glycosyltransferase family 4 protein [Deltaproteobacteria bacterium]|uniref:glycosyltransferase family 4 protein n=1 Tax=Desulfobacula sp. TaxID=2593537 RepID=UPI00198CBAEE|nr:glycosyltransferase family 4 protein [Candidatus Desulfobacula maris]MBL6992773.1 glycosyltransferase family 4 protein [Desulfobacula sp.]